MGSERVSSASGQIIISRDTARLWSVLSGVLLVATDLHGDNESYRRIRDRFVDLHAHGEVAGLVFTGDLIHREAGGEDASLDMLLDVMRLKAEYGDGILYLLGNHELPHIYGTTLARGEIEYTPPFENDLQDSGLRDRVRKFFSGLPFYLRTAAGVSLAHAGAAPATANLQNTGSDLSGLLFRWDHSLLLAQAEDFINLNDREHLRASLAALWGSAAPAPRSSGAQTPFYADLVHHYLGITEADDPHYDDLLRGYLVSRSPAYDLLWEALFTRCERQYGKAYPAILQATLESLSAGFVRQTALVSGHMAATGGYQVVARQQLRLVSGPHAAKKSDRKLLRLDAARPIDGMETLVEGLISVW